MSSDGNGRLALVGAASPTGRELKHQLASAGYPGDRIELFDLDQEVGLVTEYGDEARVILQAARDELARFPVACFCGSPETARTMVPAVTGGGGVAVDCTGAFTGEAPLAGPRTPPDAAVVAIPHPVALLLARLARALPLTNTAATVLLPASEHSREGAEALARESTRLLNFGEAEPGPDAGSDDVVAIDAAEAGTSGESSPGTTATTAAGGVDEAPTAGLHRRLAFDLWPAGAELLDRLRRQLEELDVELPALAAFRAPVFHSISVSLWLPDRSPEAVRQALAGAGIEVSGADVETKIDSPARAARSERTGPHVTDLRGDRDGSWLWSVQDNYQATAAAAVEVISLHLDPEPTSVN